MKKSEFSLLLTMCSLVFAIESVAETQLRKIETPHKVAKAVENTYVEGWGKMVGAIAVYEFEADLSIEQAVRDSVELNQDALWGFWQDCINQSEEISALAESNKSMAMDLCKDQVTSAHSPHTYSKLWRFLNEALGSRHLASIHPNLYAITEFLKTEVGRNAEEVTVLVSALSSEFYTSILLSKNSKRVIVISTAWYD